MDLKNMDLDLTCSWDHGSDLPTSKPDTPQIIDLTPSLPWQVEYGPDGGGGGVIGVAS